VKFNSFRLRIALLSAFLAGSTLIGFSLISWKLIYDAKVSRLDANLDNYLKRSMRPRDTEVSQLAANKLQSELNFGFKTPIALLVIGVDGKKLYQSNNWTFDFQQQSLFPPRPSIPLPPPPIPPRDKPFIHPDRIPNLPPPDFNLPTRYTTIDTWRVAAISAPHVQVAIAVSLQSIDQEMSIIRNIFAISIPGILLLVTLCAWSISGSALRPISQLTDVIKNVSSKGLDQRVSSNSVDVEFVELIQVFNQMLERLERSFHQASRFSADAAHELKTPLTILQGELEQALQQAPTGSDLQQRLGNLLDEIRRLSSIVRKLLLLSLADAGQMSLYKAEVNLSAMLSEMVEDLDLLAPDLAVITEIKDDLRVSGDRDLLIQVLQNLLGNAIKYNLPNGWIRIQAYQQTNTVFVTISNACAESPKSDRVFERFYRGDPAHTRKVEGIGLGLSLAREIARAHGGNLVLEASSFGETAFRLSLPILRES
jgi:two-component system heavy metal sensor histidine kinase CusS